MPLLSSQDAVSLLSIEMPRFHKGGQTDQSPWERLKELIWGLARFSISAETGRFDSMSVRSKKID